ncbi:twitching motility protein [Mycobacteroides abscessus subsp. abscessus]|nr:twitching motility protein [Mycobacteroides abscessus subsp. abscessus]
MTEAIDILLRAGFELKASDIHLTVGVPPIFRINGELKRYGKENLLPAHTEGPLQGKRGTRFFLWCPRGIAFSRQCLLSAFMHCIGGPGCADKSPDD